MREFRVGDTIIFEKSPLSSEVIVKIADGFVQLRCVTEDSSAMFTYEIPALRAGRYGVFIHVTSVLTRIEELSEI